jgi:enterochelin esterase-like enzyme
MLMHQSWNLAAPMPALWQEIVTRWMRTSIVRCRFVRLIVMAACWAQSCGSVLGDETANIRSPRLKALSAAVEAGDTTKVGAFWNEIKEQKTPLVEGTQGGDVPNDVWLTFLWQGDDTTRNVVLAGGVPMGHPYDNRFSLLPGTNVWYLTMRTRNDLRATYYLSVNDPLTPPVFSDAKAMKDRASRLKRDPLNPGSQLSGSLVELAQAPPQPWTKSRPDVPAGTLHAEKFHSSLLDNDRSVTIYRPPSYDSTGDAYPLLIVFDLEAYTFLVPTPTILNNLIQERKIPPTVALFVGNAKDARDKELPCNEKFARFLAEELLPKVRAEHHVATDPRRVAVAGSSHGGLAAAFFAFQYPELAGNVLSQSGSYWWAPGVEYGQDNPALEGDWLIRQYAIAPRKEIRFFLEVGLRETVRIENRHFRDVLRARGYDVVGYSEYNGGHDYLNWRGSLADGLIALLGPNPVAKP